MSEAKSEIASSKWFSTYGIITAERILGKYQIKLAQDELITAIKSPFSFYHKLLEIPLKNVLNGIVLQQANDYHIYAQKLFIDYLLSGENSKEEGAQGASTREAMENERQQLVLLGEEYHKNEGEHNNLIASSQAALIKITHEFNVALEQAVTMLATTLKNVGLADAKTKARLAIIHALIFCNLSEPQLQSNPFLFTEKMNEILKISFKEDIKEKIMENLSVLLNIVLNFDANVETFIERGKEMSVRANSFRSEFHDTIIRVMELIKLLPEYRIDLDQDAINREPLYFDKSIGAL
ncbi:hypothetical protein [Legionella drancourtii]|uniref:Uncharacterized protein n=1 Tax=Legionella drancourtii LLAP12 TaxID=658187 RepID=G9ERJ0_9GAMM|nr:hypothetical protein [Legionella drancourtii]EHL30159.1 hypothetical protein LDG_7905 [Legionella drancourtii LLAP12]